MRVFGGLAVAGLLAACVEADMPEAYEGQALFAQNCAICHGAGARGDGDLADNMVPPPADLTRISSRNGGTFPAAHVLSTIDGYLRSPPLGQDMPEFGLLLRGDLVPLDVGDGILSPTPRPLVALLAYLQSIQQAG